MRECHLLARTLSGLGVCILAAGLAWHLSAELPGEIQRANALQGSRWYTLELNDRRLGYWHTDTRRDAAGQWTFTSEQRFVLNPGDPVTLRSRRVFGATPPYPLLVAHYWQDRRSWSQGTEIEKTAAGYQAKLYQGRATRASEATKLEWTYTLADYLSFEIWLAQSQRAPGSSRVISTLDFERLQVVPKKLRVLERNDSGYLIENPAPHAASTIQLDEKFTTLKLKIAGLFDLTLTGREEALAARSALQTASYFIPTDKPLHNHTQIAQIVLGADADLPLDQLWNAQRLADGEWTLTLRANPLSATPATRSSPAETLGFPSTHPEISRLAERAIQNVDSEAEQVSALVEYVHDFLTYQPGAEPKPVLALIDNPLGDCTEFADLFTTLARSIGLPSRTVFGLAYSMQDTAFAFHAWNEVAVNGEWQAVDPTWNQTRVDATHIPLPQGESASLQLLTGALNLEFSIKKVTYFDSTENK